MRLSFDSCNFQTWLGQSMMRNGKTIFQDHDPKILDITHKVQRILGLNVIHMPYFGMCFQDLGKPIPE